MKKNGFTLAEVLITLGIIGVVSAMTIPTLIHKYKNDEYVAGMKKAYATLSQAVLSAKEQVGLENLGSTSPDRITEQMECMGNVNNSLSNIFPNSWSIDFLSGSSSNCSLSNGSNILIRKKKNNAYNDYYYWNYGAAAIDTNGEKQPNELGRDRWLFLIMDDGRVIPAGAEIRDSNTGSYVGFSYFEPPQIDCGSNATNNYGCGGYLLKNNWVMDY
jgi:prepilin-type N-terminal cleavage/methylation domain-containing protein